jgi:hypothetical protein
LSEKKTDYLCLLCAITKKNSRLFLDLQSSPIVLGEAESRASSARLRDICNLRARLSEVEKTLSIFLGERIFRAETTEKGLMQTYVTQNV